MVKTLPARFDPDLMDRGGTRYEATMSVRHFPRLAALLVSADGEVRASASFSRRKDHIVVAGRLRAAWPLECQRCLEPITVPIDEPYELVFVDSEAAARDLPEEFDPVVLDDSGRIGVVDLFEDELMLHVPSFPRHDEGERCASGERSFGELPADVAEDETGRPNPFRVLKDLNIH